MIAVQGRNTPQTMSSYCILYGVVACSPFYANQYARLRADARGYLPTPRDTCANTNTNLRARTCDHINDTRAHACALAREHLPTYAYVYARLGPCKAEREVRRGINRQPNCLGAARLLAIQHTCVNGRCAGPNRHLVFAPGVARFLTAFPGSFAVPECFFFLYISFLTARGS